MTPERPERELLVSVDESAAWPCLYRSCPRCRVERPAPTIQVGTRKHQYGPRAVPLAWASVVSPELCFRRARVRGNRGAQIRTGDLSDPNGARYQAAPHPETAP